MPAPILETADDIADVWTRWLTGGEDNRWVKAIRATAACGICFRDWGGGLPERGVRLLPFCIEALSASGESLGQVSRLRDLVALSARAA